MRRLAAIGVVLAVIVFAALTLGAGGGKSSGGDYKIELDNAFGLVQGADLKVAGVRAGKIKNMKVDLKTKKAIVSFQVIPGEFNTLREDVFCESRPQSLIGEYFIDCNPGVGKALKKGSTIPVTKTASTIPPDLVGNILRLPYRQRLRIIISELGSAVAGRDSDLNETLRRAVPALRETDNLLAVLAEQNRVIADLTTNADTVVTALADNRANVGRWVTEAKNAAAASAERSSDIQGSFQRLPGFLEELRPTMVSLGRVADEQTPALQDLNASRKQLTRFFNDLGPFADASRPSIRSLGEASVVGDQAGKSAKPTIQLLKNFAAQAPEVGKNLSIILNDLDDPHRAVEHDPRAAAATGRPAPAGWTGLEALLQYVFNQEQSTNVFDKNAYILKVALFGGDCAPYRNRETLTNPGPISPAPGALTGPQLKAKCGSYLGPTYPGIPASTDPTHFRTVPGGTQQGPANRAATATPATPNAAHAAPGHGTADVPASTQQGPAINIQQTLSTLLGTKLPNVQVPHVAVPQLPSGQQLPRGQSANDLLNYLLGP
jgi:phospholipid/cholesterol/gamma-HCH transport system substrate-binding protein